MKIACVGGGPGGLYFAISMKLRDPSAEVAVHERNRPGETFGWGVVFSDQTLDRLEANDPISARSIQERFYRWDAIDVHFRGSCLTSGGHGFSGISRRTLLLVLQERARELGVELHFESEVAGPDALPEADLVVAADGANSRVRAGLAAELGTDVDRRANRYVWLGTRRTFEAFTFVFRETEHGWIQVHAYRFEPETSTFIVECPEAVWRGLGFDRMGKEETLRACEALFADHLGGHPLLDNAAHLPGSSWLNFPRVSNERWFHGNVVLLGDAAHTAHFSIGSGTKLAMEDGIALADHLTAAGGGGLQCALQAYQDERRLEVLRLQSAARNSTEWFENVGRYTRLEPPQFVYALLTRSQRVSHENLRLRDREWLEGFERWFFERAAGPDSRRGPSRPVPPMFTPFRLRGLELANRVVVSPMCMYSSEDGMPSDFHLVHLGARAQGGAALVFTEMTDVSREGRISPACAGIFRAEHVAAWRRIVDFVHDHTAAKIAMQLGHAGPKASTRRPWEGSELPLEDGNWEALAPSAVPFAPVNQVPRAMTRGDMDRVREEFVRATRMAEEAGFDLLELHCAHGYLLSAFITPLLNHRADEYGGALENRLRYPLEVFRACRATWPEAKPMSVRISATDWVDGGIDSDDAVEIARAFRAAGADVIDVSAGQTSPEALPVYGRMFQTPFADRIRNEAGIATLAVGNIFEPDHVNSIVAAGRADLCCLARPHLADPYWTLHAAASLGYDPGTWPVQYAPGKEQYLRNLQRAAELAINI
ncbi:MAG TPA: bifunctional salicylyl-CoA 5-hydroxylase/oxidoreductase [Thermoanaerobaculia bacterium]|nr:bifunctional salicylyl-CoA 5-hydroxylase/oxidoreductase [Thermoanaerobaculia bacterium]